MTHNFHPSILRAYDIRGIYEKTLFDSDAYFVGKSFASFLTKEKKDKVVVGCDGRESSPALKEQLIKGLLESGIDVTDIGVGPTPMLYFSVFHLNFSAGIMITGSHNPKNHNGFKIALRDRPFYGDDIQQLARICEKSDFVIGNGTFRTQEVKEDYTERLLSDCVIAGSSSHLLDELDNFEPKKKLKIAWDAGNGSAGEIMKKLSDRILAEHVLLFEEIDGTFPNHHPDPTEPHNLEDLIATIKNENCDFGIAFDGDGDRIGVVDNEGGIIWGDQLMVFFAREVLQNNPGATIIADVKASNVLFDEITKAGGKAVMWKTGHSLIKAQMKKTGALIAGEMSGHIFFADQYYGFDDALYAAIRIINIVYNSNQSLAEMRKSLPKTFSTPEVRIECSDERKFKVIEQLKDNLHKTGLKFNDVDGVRAQDEKGWWLIRASNTQPVLVARCEAGSLENLEEMKKNLRDNLKFSLIEIPQELQ
jgi:phosphomannomutase